VLSCDLLGSSCIAGVHDQVDQHLLQLHGVGIDQRRLLASSY